LVASRSKSSHLLEEVRLALVVCGPVDGGEKEGGASAEDGDRGSDRETADVVVGERHDGVIPEDRHAASGAIGWKEEDVATIGASYFLCCVWGNVVELRFLDTQDRSFGGASQLSDYLAASRGV
jgi:hypothetical protein